MKRDFIKELGYRALDNRLKRVSDQMSHETRKFFKSIDLDVEPSWHLVFKLLKEKEILTMVDIAEELGYTHPSTVAMLKKMKSKGYITSEQDQNDKRKYNISLTQKSFDLLPELEIIWESCERAIYEMLKKDLSILKHLDEIESALMDTSFDVRFYNEYQKVRN